MDLGKGATQPGKGVRVCGQARKRWPASFVRSRGGLHVGQSARFRAARSDIQSISAVRCRGLAGPYGKSWSSHEVCGKRL